MSLDSMIISIVLTVVILILSLFTISKGYGFKHKVDKLENEDENTVDGLNKYKANER